MIFIRLILLLVLLVVGTQVADAQSYSTLIDAPFFDNGDEDADGEGRRVPRLLNGLYAALIALAAILAVLKIIVAGVKYMLSDVVTSKEDAKKDIKNSLLGLLIIMATYLILNVINPNLLNLNIFSNIRPITIEEPPQTPVDPNQAAVDDVVDTVIASTTDETVCGVRTENTKDNVRIVTANFTNCKGGAEKTQPKLFSSFCRSKDGKLKNNGTISTCEITVNPNETTTMSTLLYERRSSVTIVDSHNLIGAERKICEDLHGKFYVENTARRGDERGKNYFSTTCNYPAVYGYSTDTNANRLDCRENLRGGHTTDGRGFSGYALYCIVP